VFKEQAASCTDTTLVISNMYNKVRQISPTSSWVRKSSLHIWV